MSKYPFLSDDWFGAVKQVLDEHGDAPAPHQALIVNMVVTDSPFDADREFHMGARDGGTLLDLGHTEGADVTLTLDYATAKDIFVSGNPQAGMQAFMAGKVKVQGDMAKLMAAGASGGGPGNPQMAAKLQEITE